MKGRKTLWKIVVEEVDVIRGNAMEGVEVAGEDGGFVGKNAMEGVEAAGEGGGIVGVNAAEGELTTRSKVLNKNT